MKAVASSDKAYSLFVKADMAWDKNELAKAFGLFSQGAELGDMASQLNLGYFFDRGLHVKRNRDKALHWYHKAYHQGDAAAANNIALVHKDRGDYGRMHWWFRRAVKLGDQETLIEIAKCFEAGLGCDKDLRKAAQYYHRVLQSTFVSEGGKETAVRRLQVLKRSSVSKRR